MHCKLCKSHFLHPAHFTTENLATPRDHRVACPHSPTERIMQPVHTLNDPNLRLYYRGALPATAPLLLTFLQPHEADAATQTAMAKKLQAQSGWGQWPGCADKLGLR